MNVTRRPPLADRRPSRRAEPVIRYLEDRQESRGVRTESANRLSVRLAGRLYQLVPVIRDLGLVALYAAVPSGSAARL